MNPAIKKCRNEYLLHPMDKPLDAIEPGGKHEDRRRIGNIDGRCVSVTLRPCVSSWLDLPDEVHWV
jgi:hypothetical protein